MYFGVRRVACLLGMLAWIAITPAVFSHDVGYKKMLDHGGGGSMDEPEEADSATPQKRRTGPRQPPRRQQVDESPEQIMARCGAMQRDIMKAFDSNDAGRAAELVDKFDSRCSHRSDSFAELAEMYKKRLAKSQGNNPGSSMQGNDGNFFNEQNDGPDEQGGAPRRTAGRNNGSQDGSPRGSRGQASSLNPDMAKAAASNPELAKHLETVEELIEDQQEGASGGKNAKSGETAGGGKASGSDAGKGGSGNGSGASAGTGGGSATGGGGAAGGGGGSKGLPVAECDRQVQASGLMQKLEAIPKDNTVLLMRGAIAVTKFAIKTFEQCLPDARVQEQIRQWKIQLDQTQKACRGTSNDSAQCDVSPF